MSANLLESGLVLAKPGACLIIFADGQIGLFSAGTASAEKIAGIGGAEPLNSDLVRGNGPQPLRHV